MDVHSIEWQYEGLHYRSLCSSDWKNKKLYKAWFKSILNYFEKYIWEMRYVMLSLKT